MEPYKYIIYNPVKKGEFAAISKENLKKKVLLASNMVKHKTKKKKTNHQSLKSLHSSPSENTLTLLPSLDKPVSYTFARSVRNLVLESATISDKRFDFNPRSTQPDPYYLTHKRCVAITSRLTANIDFSKELSRNTKLKQEVGIVTGVRDSFASTRSGVSFAKMLSRKEAATKPCESFPLTALDGDLGKLSTQKRIIVPKFDLFKARYKKGQELPSYMECVNNRMSITRLSYEMLRANNYYEDNAVRKVTVMRKEDWSGKQSARDAKKSLFKSKGRL